MRQFILTIGTLAAVLISCWDIFQGISSILRNELEDSLYHLLLTTPIYLSLAVTFDYVNSQLHTDYRRFRKSISRSKGTQGDILHPHSKEVEDTPWEDDSSHTQ
ncbi:MAG: hypothetical protein KJO21_10030 [Verrucomicrobiae bacterium]|nr:hypothetical protein [Verrucomicrobiae bacterium]NNJ43798.1 hypothetical protein [Akkermansiaceae bacterium]